MSWLSIRSILISNSQNLFYDYIKFNIQIYKNALGMQKSQINRYHSIFLV
jgi:hypothetical protein